MLFSIVIPVYNVEKYLGECVESILKQTLSDYEVILVNDGSTDSSGKICDEYSLKYNQIKTIHKENGGQADARNLGAKSATGEYITFIDSDDYISDVNFLSDLKAKIDETHSEMITYKFQKFDDGSTELQPCGFSMKEAENIENSDELLLNLVKADAYYGSPWIKIIKRSVITDNNIEFEKGLLGEDMEWSCHLLTKVNTISVIDKPYIAYRQRQGSTSRAHKLKNLTDYIYILEKWSENNKSNSVTPARQEAVNGILAKYYANLLICYLRVGDPQKKNCKPQIKKLSSLLNYSKSQRPLLIKKVYSIVGFEGTVILLKILDKVKG